MSPVAKYVVDGVKLRLLQFEPRSGYFRVEDPDDGRKGWIHESFLDVVGLTPPIAIRGQAAEGRRTHGDHEVHRGCPGEKHAGITLDLDR